MHGIEVSVIYDLSASSESPLRDALLAKLHDGNTLRTSFEHGGATVHPITDNLVHVEFSRYGMSFATPVAFEGLRDKMAEIKESGTDHFPAAGLYHFLTLPENVGHGASAMVRWELDHTQLSLEKVAGTVAQDAHSSSGSAEATRPEVQVVYRRSWSLILTAPTLSRARATYELLRDGRWKPNTFIDLLPDTEKLGIVRQTVEDQE